MDVYCFGERTRCQRAEPCESVCALRVLSPAQRDVALMDEGKIAEDRACGPDFRLHKWATESELAYSAEKRATFWRLRCLEHAAEIEPLRATLGLALVALEYHRDQTRQIGLSDEAIQALRLALGPNDQANGHCPRRTDDDH